MRIEPTRTVIGYLVAVFVVGLAIGLPTGYALAKRSPSRLPSEQEFETQWLAKYKSDLALSPEQVESIRPLLPEAVTRLGGIWYRAIMTMGAVHESVDRKVEPFLDAQQRVRLLAMIREGREKRVRIARGNFSDEATVDNDIWTAAKAGSIDAIKKHLRNGADINERDLGFGLTPLTTAAIHGRTEAVGLLLSEGANINARNADGGTALHATAFFGRPESMKKLLANGADLTARNGDGDTPGDISTATWGSIQFIADILQVDLEQGETLAGQQAVAVILAEANGAEP